MHYFYWKIEEWLSLPPFLFISTLSLYLSSLPYFHSQKRLNKLISLIIWVSACVMGAVFAIVLMGLVWDRFQTTPTITTGKHVSHQLHRLNVIHFN